MKSLVAALVLFVILLNSSATAQTTNLRSFYDARTGLSFSYPRMQYAPVVCVSDYCGYFDAGGRRRLLTLGAINDPMAMIVVFVEDAPFDKGMIAHEYAPTGMEGFSWLRLVRYGHNVFLSYSGGNSASLHPDQFFYNLNGRILGFAFDGPFNEGDVMPNADAITVEHIVLGSLKVRTVAR